MSPKRDEDYHIRDYQPGDEAAIVTLFEIVFGTRLTEEQWRWKYISAVPEPPAKLAFNTAGQLIGFAGAVSLRGWRKGRPIPFFQICDVMVHPSARGHLGSRNVFTQLLKLLIADLAARYPCAFAYGFPGRRPFQLGEHSRVYGLIEAAYKTCCPAQKPRWSLVRTQALHWEDTRLGVLWADLSSNLALSLIRDRAYLRWRYAKNPFHTYQLIGFLFAGQLLGWAVIQPGERLQIIDFLISRRWFKSALTALNRVAIDNHCTAMEIWLPKSWQGVAGVHTEKTEVRVANMMSPLLISTKEAQQSLYYTMGDLDIF
ncbi:MAG: hypothetical protein CSA09_05215 [Candidatus Contendobacter odensis]|uniref:N-acetyltransferase domain-containing protein n=1 Tax=Candidatus Contendibacter odensensis TaxID=1400860 RepID=A0A2G6PE29_9GAMM|nr:MAG: hypothetical protein CSA09_05215 [Candidatus Contendobacter odensis]